MSKPNRQWSDAKDKALTKGKWSAEEISHLKRLLCKYAARKKLTPEQLASLCSDSTPVEFKNVWTKLARFFPNRSVQSLHNCCKRNFNPFNYKGEWTLKEERILIEYVAANGNKWKELGELLQRTALNIKDKWKQMGGAHNKLRKTGAWNVEETVELVRLVFLSQGLVFEEQGLDGGEDSVIESLLRAIEKNKKTFKKHEITWEAVSEVFKTRSSVDCRTRWSYIINYKIPHRMTFTAEDDKAIFREIRKQNAKKVEEINFAKVKNKKSPEDNTFRFKVLAKAMSGRLKLSLAEILEKLEYSYDETEYQKPAEDNILEYYTSKYNKK